ncbi:glycosyltransferase [Rhizobium sp. F40D2]|uniref:glycosyltransferase family 2 protein n=1 Tax=Rhizobium sp. F40D2 TaxID=3453141 RepID=UPI003F217404
MNRATIDVVIPVFNGQDYIEHAIKSVQNQSLTVEKIIIADDGSHDSTSTIVDQLKKFDDRIVWLQLPHAGVSAARNSGIKASSSEFVAFLDADDIWLPRKLELQIDAFRLGGNKVGFVHSSYFFIDESGNRLSDKNVVPPKQRGAIFMPLLVDSYVLSGSASSVLVRREVLEQCGYFDQRLFYGEDWDLWLRLAAISDVDFTDEAVVGIRVHDQSAQRRSRPGRELEFFQQHLIVYEKWQHLLTSNPEFVQTLRRRAVCTVLPALRNPLEVNRFYTGLSKIGDVLGAKIFRNRVHFWWQVFLEILRYLKWRLKGKESADAR